MLLCAAAPPSTREEREDHDASPVRTVCFSLAAHSEISRALATATHTSVPVLPVTFTVRREPLIFATPSAVYTILVFRFSARALKVRRGPHTVENNIPATSAITAATAKNGASIYRAINLRVDFRVFRGSSRCDARPPDPDSASPSWPLSETSAVCLASPRPLSPLRKASLLSGSPA